MIDWKVSEEAKEPNRGSREGTRKKRENKQPTLIRRRSSKRENRQAKENE